MLAYLCACMHASMCTWSLYYICTNHMSVMNILWSLPLSDLTYKSHCHHGNNTYFIPLLIALLFHCFTYTHLTSRRQCHFHYYFIVLPIPIQRTIPLCCYISNHSVTTKGRKEMFYLMMHSTHFIYRYMEGKEGNVLFNDALNTFYLLLYGVGHMVKDHSDSEKGNLLLPHELLFPISSKGSFICIIPQTG